MHSTYARYAIKRLLSFSYIAVACFACFFRHYGGVFYFNRWCLRSPFEENGQGHNFSPVVPKGAFGKNLGTCFSID